MSRAHVTVWDIPMEVDFDYSPAESRTWDHPGSPAEASICAVLVGGVDIVEMLSDEQHQRIEEAVLSDVLEAA